MESDKVSLQTGLLTLKEIETREHNGCAKSQGEMPQEAGTASVTEGLQDRTCYGKRILWRKLTLESL